MKKKAILFTLITLLILALIGGGIYWYRRQGETDNKVSKEKIQNFIDNFDIENIRKETYSDNVKKYSKKYDLFTDIYLSDKLVFVYGYEKGAIKKHYSEKFHKTIQKMIKDNHLDEKYTVIALSKPQKTVEDTIKKNKLGLANAESTCDLTDPNDKGVLEIIDTTAPCYYGVCIMNPKKNEYILLLKDYPELILKVMQEYK